MNKLTPEELYVIKSFASLCVSPIKEMILKDLEILTIKESSPDRSFIIFDLPGYDRPVKGQRTYGMDGKLLDKDGRKFWFFCMRMKMTGCWSLNLLDGIPRK